MSEERLPEEFYTLFRRCVVEVRAGKKKKAKGTGFFVAPGCVVTAAHLLEQGSSNPTIVWQGQRLEAEVIPIDTGSNTNERKLGQQDLVPNIVLLRVDLDSHPCVLLGTALAIRDPIYIFGHSDLRPDGDSVTTFFEGPVSGNELKIKSGQVRPGLSGAPILNQRTGEVVGIVQKSRGRGGSLGGYATPVGMLFVCKPDVQGLNGLYHEKDSRWRDLLSHVRAPIPRRSRPRAVTWICALLGGVAVASVPFVWDTLPKATAVILPFSSTAGEEQTSENLTQGFLEEWNRVTDTPALDPRLVRPMAATLSYRGNLCAPIDVLETVRKLTGAAYVVNGSFETYKTRQPRTLSLCLQSTWDHRRVDFVRKEWVPEAGRNALGEVAARFGNCVEVPLATLLSLREGRVTSDQEAVREYFEGLLHFRRYELKRAVDSFLSAIARAPDFYLAHDGLAHVWQELGHDGEAADEARKALTLFGNRTNDERQLALLRASVLGTQGKWSLVAYIYRTLWQKDKSDSLAASRLAEAQNLSQSSEDALNTILEIRKRQGSGTLEITVELDARLDVEESIAHHNAGRFFEQGRAAERAIEKSGLDHDLLEARALYLRCDSLVSQSPPSWSDLCKRAESSFNSGNDRINWAKFLQLEARFSSRKESGGGNSSGPAGAAREGFADGSEGCAGVFARKISKGVC